MAASSEDTGCGLGLVCCSLHCFHPPCLGVLLVLASICVPTLCHTLLPPVSIPTVYPLFFYYHYFVFPFQRCPPNQTFVMVQTKKPEKSRCIISHPHLKSVCVHERRLAFFGTLPSLSFPPHFVWPSIASVSNALKKERCWVELLFRKSGPLSIRWEIGNDCHNDEECPVWVFLLRINHPPPI